MARYRERALQRTEVVSIRFHRNEVAMLKAAAVQSGRSLSDYVRERCMSSLPAPTPLLAFPVIPHYFLTSLRNLYASANTAHLRAFSWKGFIEGHRYKRHPKEDIYKILDDLGAILEQHHALAGRLLQEAGVQVQNS